MAILAGVNFDEMTFNPVTSDFARCGDPTSIVGRGEFLYIHCFITLVVRYVAVYMDATDILQICEFEVYQEQGKKSTYCDVGYFCMYSTLRNSQFQALQCLLMISMGKIF